MEAMIEKVNALKARERALIMLVVIVLFLVIWDALFFSKQYEHWKSINTELTTLDAKLIANEALEQQLGIQVSQDPNVRERIRLERLQSEVERLDGELRKRTIEFISPQEMVAVLKKMIDNQADLKLIQLKTLGASPLIKVAPVSSGDEASDGQNMDADQQLLEVQTESEKEELTANVYRHSMEMSLRGGYFSVVTYLKKLETIGWRFDWDKVSLAMDKYPISDVKIQISTLSMEEGWIGV